MTRKLTLDCRLSLEDPMRSPDGAGGYIETWSELGTLWAHIAPRSGRETADRSILKYRIYVRRMPHGASARPRPDQRFRDGARVFHIEAVSDLPDDPRHLLCYAREELAG